MRYIELAFTVEKSQAEVLADALVEAGAGGVEERDEGTLERAGAGQTMLVVWVEEGSDAVFLRNVENARAGVLEGAKVETRGRDEDEWRDAWKRFFSTRKIGRYVIVPSWEKYAPVADEVRLDLDPGRAFGTGGHASTRLCLRALSKLKDAKRILDAGCGSGVLAIAACKAWPTCSGLGVDVDGDAIDVSRENAQRNAVLDRLEFSTDRVATVAGDFDLITANIQPEILIPMAPDLDARLLSGGTIILAGILVEASPPVEACYTSLGLTLVEAIDEDGWRALVYKKP